jgi:transcriptional regulator with XRE-family HTH domain
MPPLKRMAKRIQQLRESRGWSQQALAAKARISREYLARLETGRQDPRVSVLLKIARALGKKVTVNDLLK